MRWCAVVIGLALFLAASAHAEDLVVNASGRAPIGGGPALAARGQALGNALDQALIKAVARIMEIDREDLTDDQLDLIEAKLLPARKDVQEKFEVLEEGPTGDGDGYSVRVRAVFLGDKLRDRLLGLELTKRSRVRETVMVMIPEYHIRHYIPDPAAETEIIRLFTEARYHVVDQQQIAAIRNNDQAAAASRGDNAAAASIGRKFGAEIIIVGEAFSEAINDPLTQSGGMQSCRARGEVRMLRTDNAEILAANGLHASGADATEDLAAKRALANAGGMIGKYLLDQLDKRQREDKKEGAARIVELVVMDIPYAKYAQLKEAMKARIQGVRDFRQKLYEANRAELEVEYEGSDAQALADALATTRFQDFKLTIVKASMNRIDMKVAPR
jgi:hypothetical protein